MTDSPPMAPGPGASPNSLPVTHPIPQLPVDPNVPPSRQNPGETWKDFLGRMRTRILRRYEQASDKQIQKWTSRAKSAKSHRPPGQGGATVFEWRDSLEVELDPETPGFVEGFLYRVHVPRRQVQDLWEHYPRGQRVFNEVDDEWDLCEKLDPDAISDYEWFENQLMPQTAAGDHISGPPPPTPPMSPHSVVPSILTQVALPPLMSAPAANTIPHLPVPPSALVAAVTAATPGLPFIPTVASSSTSTAQVSSPRSTDGNKHNVLANFDLDLSLQYNTSEDPVPLPTTSFESVLRSLYGFIWDRDSYEHTPSLSWKKAVYTIAHEPYHKDCPEALQRAIADFVKLISEEERGSRLPLLWDLHLLSAHPFEGHRRTNWRMQVTIVKVTPGSDVGYVIRTPELHSRKDMVLFVPRASTVMFCLRREWGPRPLSVLDVALVLFENGMKFSLRYPRPVTPCPATTLMYRPEIGWRPKGYKFAALDYNAYENRCREFFKQHFTRAALEMGGIIGRLAREYIGQDVVLMGPALEVGRSAHIFDGIKTAYWGDTLADEDMNLICGVYRAATNGKLVPVLHIPI
jgi:hypothetical protein